MPENTNVTNSIDGITPEQTVSIDLGKRSLEEPEVDNDERKKFKTNEDVNNDQPTLSKRQIKKIQKQQYWLDQKAKRKEVNKEKKQERKKWKAQMREAGVAIQKVKTKKMAESTCKQRIVLDMSYDDLMSDKDLCKCSNQILRCYGVNRRMENPMQLYFCSFGGKIKETLAKHKGSEHWDIKYVEESFDKVFKKEEIVYLTSDSLNVLENVDDSKVYIIGGLVDHNSCKGVSLKAAENLGIAHARLPIDKYVNMQTRQILTINHVYEIISKVVSGISWKDAFVDTIPKRKIFFVKDSLDQEIDSQNNEEEEEIKCPDTKVDKNTVEQNTCI